VSLQTQPPSLDWPHYGISFSGAITRGFKKYAKFEGRASRSEYWWWTLFTALVLTVLGLLSMVIGLQTSPDGGETPGAPAVPLLVLLGLFYLAILVPTIALTVRRLHDVGYSGWLVLLGLVPSVGGLILLVFAVLPSSPAGAKYDPPSAYPPGSYPPAQYPPNPYQQYPPT
jgi:uncharacterized membrane protein YhaH (DUF805 family)